MSAGMKLLWLLFRPFFYFFDIGLIAIAFCFYHAENDVFSACLCLVAAIYVAAVIHYNEKRFKMKTVRSP